jgi:eukaryotic-like serine/threonine-protein kinase
METAPATRAFGSGMAADAFAELVPGARLGDWRIEAKIGEGGMGHVYAAVHDVIGKRAAIKVIKRDACATPDAAERLVQEARLVNQIAHPNVVDIFHVGQLDDGRPYLVMELLCGGTLGDRLAHARVPPVEAIEVLLQICAALEAAHARGVVHRDLKPDNVILVEHRGATLVKLVDWGIAKHSETHGSSVDTMIGTPRYLSPEQARGRHVDRRSDIYSLGVIAYEVFLDVPPFFADNVADLLAMHLREAPPPPAERWPEIPERLAAMLVAMLAKEAAARPTLADCAAALRDARDELLARSGGIAIGTPAEAPAATANLAVAQGEWSSASPPVGDRDALLDTHTAAPRARRASGTSLAIAVIAALAGVGLIGAELAAPPPARDLAAPPAALARSVVVPQASAPARPAPTPTTTLDLRFEPRAATVRIDGAAQPAADGRWVQRVTPGVYRVEIRADGHVPYVRSIEVGATPVTLAVELEATAAPPAPAARPRGTRPRGASLHPDGTIDPFD